MLLLFLFLLPTAATAQTWLAYDSSAYVLFVPSSFASVAVGIGSSLDSGFTAPISYLGLRSPRIPVVVEDLGCMTSGLADPCFGIITISSFSPGHRDLLECCCNWWRLVGAHEYTHIAHLQTAGGVLQILHRVVGFPITPNLFTPYFLHEGLAVLAESLGSQYEGRLNAGPFDYWIDLLSRANRIPDIAEAVYTPFGFPGKNGPYLLGSAFVAYLSESCGLSSVHDFVSTSAASVLTFAAPIFPANTLDRVAVSVLGQSLPQLWDDWKSSLRPSERTAEDFTDISTSGGVTGPPSLVENWVLYGRNIRTKTGALRAWPYHEIVAYDVLTGEETIVARNTASIEGATRSRQGEVYYLSDQLRRGFANFSNRGYGYVRDLWKLDLETRKRVHLLRAPIRAFDIDNDGTIYYAEDRIAPFGSRIWRMSGDGEPEVVFELNELVLDIVVSGAQGIVIAKQWNSLPQAHILNLTTGTYSAILPPFTSAAWLQANGNEVTASVQSGSEYSVAYLDLASGVMNLFPEVGYTQGAVYDDARQLLYCVCPSLRGLDVAAVRTVPTLFPYSLGAEDPYFTGDEDSSACVESNPLFLDLSFSWPSIRVPFFDPTTGNPGILLVGQDALGALSYALLPSVDLETAQFHCPTAFQILPVPQVRLQGALGLAGENLLMLSFDVPIYRALAAGVQAVDLGLAGRWSIGERDGLLVPNVTCQLYYPELALNFDCGLQFAITESDEDGTLPAVVARVRGRAPCAGGETGFSVSLWPGALPDTILGVVALSPGITSLGSPEFGALIERWLPLCEIDKGLWSPSIYVGGACARLFAEARVSGQLPRFSIGVDLVVEIGLLFRLYAAAGVSISVDESLHPRIEFVLRDVRDMTQTY